jgi:hypothetical protein
MNATNSARDADQRLIHSGVAGNEDAGASSVKEEMEWARMGKSVTLREFLSVDYIRGTCD